MWLVFTSFLGFVPIERLRDESPIRSCKIGHITHSKLGVSNVAIVVAVAAVVTQCHKSQYFTTFIYLTFHHFFEVTQIEKIQCPAKLAAQYNAISYL